jgi:Transposase DDE domain
MAHPTRSRTRRQIQELRNRFAQRDGLPFADVLPAQRIEDAIEDHGGGWREDVFTPILTLWAFLTQVICPVGCCRLAVARVMAWLVAHGQQPCGPGTGGYCKARVRLPEGVLTQLTRQTGRALHDGTPQEWLWKGRRVQIADGTTVTMPDTPDNQAEYPHHGSQADGIGFPQIRLVALFSLACGAITDVALGPSRGKQSGENALLRQIAGSVESGSVLLADRYFGGWFDLALWIERGVDVVTRIHQKRATDFRRGRRLGREDHVILWPKRQRPDWMDRETYLRLPAELAIREIRVRVPQRGFRTRVLVIATTLTDPKVRAEDLAELYRTRWQAELDLRSVKVTLGMDVLRCQSPEMVRKELWAHLLAYNLIRTAMAQVASSSQRQPRELSVAGTVQALAAFAEVLGTASGYESFVRVVLAYRVGNRPNRFEPRARKRRPKPYPPLTVPRDQARNRLCRST